MSEVYKSIKAGLEEAIDYAKGKKSTGREFQPIPIDIKSLRERLGTSQNKFAQSFGIRKI